MRNHLSRIFFGAMLGFVHFVGHSQNFSFREFENEKDSMRRIEMGRKSWSHYIRNNLDSLELIGLEFVNTDSTLLYDVGIRNLGSYQIRGDDINKGIVLLEEARQLFNDSKSMILLSETENELGNAYYLLGDNNLAIEYYLASIVHGSGATDITARYNGMIGFGKAVCAMGDTVRGVLFIQEYLERGLRDEKFEAAADACGYLGMVAGANGRVELMSAYYRRGIIYSNRSNSKAHNANAITNKAIDYFYHDKVDSSLYFFRESLKMRQEVGATRPIVESYYNLAILNIETDNLEEAKKYAELGESLSSEKGIRSWQLDCLLLLLEIAEKTNDLGNIDPIRLDIERIQNELDEMSTLDEEIIQLAVDFTSLHDTPIRRSYLWELVSSVAIVMSCVVLIYSYRPNSTSADTRV